MTTNDLFMELYREKYGDHITRELAENIVNDFAVTDGSGATSGEHWKYDDCVALGDKLGVNWEVIPKCEYYIVCNMIYSDYGQTIKKHGMSDTFMGELARDWFTDADAKPDKTFRYFFNF